MAPIAVAMPPTAMTKVRSVSIGTFLPISEASMSERRTPVKVLERRSQALFARVLALSL